MRFPDKPGVVPDRMIKEMLSEGSISLTDDAGCVISPSTLNMRVARQTGNSATIKKGSYRDIYLNMRIDEKHPDVYFFADANSSTARTGLTVTVMDEHDNVLPRQPESEYAGSVTPHPKGRLIARVEAKSFPVPIRRGMAIANLRAFYRNPGESKVDPLTAGQIVSVQGKYARPETADGMIVMHLDLSGCDEYGNAGYAAKMRTPMLKTNEINPQELFFNHVKPREGEAPYHARRGRFYLFCTKEALDMTGRYAKDGQPLAGFMRREMRRDMQRDSASGWMTVDLATMLDTEPPKKLAVEIAPDSNVRLYDGDPICMVELYAFCMPPEGRKDHNGGNRHLGGKLFRRKY